MGAMDDGATVSGGVEVSGADGEAVGGEGIDMPGDEEYSDGELDMMKRAALLTVSLTWSTVTWHQMKTMMCFSMKS